MKKIFHRKKNTLKKCFFLTLILTRVRLLDWVEDLQLQDDETMSSIFAKEY